MGIRCALPTLRTGRLAPAEDNQHHPAQGDAAGEHGQQAEVLVQHQVAEQQGHHRVDEGERRHQARAHFAQQPEVRRDTRPGSPARPVGQPEPGVAADAAQIEALPVAVPQAEQCRAAGRRSAFAGSAPANWSETAGVGATARLRTPTAGWRRPPAGRRAIARLRRSGPGRYSSAGQSRCRPVPGRTSPTMRVVVHRAATPVPRSTTAGWCRASPACRLAKTGWRRSVRPGRLRSGSDRPAIPPPQSLR